MIFTPKGPDAVADEKPSLIYFNGEIVPWAEAQVHVWSETAIRASNVFEGIRAFWDCGASHWNLVALPQHLNRLMQSAVIMRSREDKARGICPVEGLIAGTRQTATMNADQF